MSLIIMLSTFILYLLVLVTKRSEKEIFKMRFVKVRFALCIIVLLFFTYGCQKNSVSMNNSNQPIHKQASNPTSESNQTTVNTKTNSDVKGYYAKDKDNLRGTDFETIYTMCKSLLSEYYYEKAKKADIDFSKYISNANLLAYSQKKTVEESHASTIKDISFGIAKAELRRDGYFYLYVVAEVTGEGDSGFGEGTEFLVKNQDGRLVISDWYTPHGTASYYDDKIRNDASLRLAGGWDDEDFVSKVFLKAGIKKTK